MRTLPVFTFALPAVLLLGALGFQYIGDLYPCELCITQRWPHLLGACLGLVAILITRPAMKTAFTALGALAIGTSGAVAIYHSGVERKWWAGPTGCSGTVDADASVEDFLKQLKDAPVNNCGDIPWDLFGLSMANYNALISLGGAAFILWWLLTRQDSAERA